MFRGLFEEIRKEIELEEKRQLERKRSREANSNSNSSNQMGGKKSKEDFIKQFADQMRQQEFKRKSEKSRDFSFEKQRKLKSELQKKHNNRKPLVSDKKKNLNQTIISQNEESFEERYGTRDHFVDSLYVYSDAAPTEVVRTVSNSEKEANDFKVVSRNTKSIGKSYAKRLKNRNNAREAFINSVIFERKI